ncbi:MAG: hypothetical protein ACXWTS_02130 [Methylococcaceae bacterium]
MKTTSQLFHRQLLAAIIAIVCAISPTQTQALSFNELQSRLLYLLLINRILPYIQTPLRVQNLAGDAFNTTYVPSTSSPFSSFSGFNLSSSCGWQNLTPSLHIGSC